MTYTILLNKLLINAIDVYSVYKVFLTEESQGKQTNMSALLKASNLKTRTAVNIREEKGEKYPADLMPVNEARDVTLYFAVHGDTLAGFLSNYRSFIAFIKAGTGGKGWLNIKVAEIDETFKMFVDECGEYEQLTYLEDGQVASRFKIKFHEPQPTI